MTYRSSHRPDGHFETPQPKPEFNPETAGPDQVIEHFRNDVLYQDLEDFELQLPESAETGNVHQRRSRLLEQFCLRTFNAKLYLLHQLHRPLNGDFNPAGEQTEAFLRAEAPDQVAAKAGLSPEALGLQILDEREDILLRAYDDALAMQQEHQLGNLDKLLDKGKN